MLYRQKDIDDYLHTIADHFHINLGGHQGGGNDDDQA